MAEHAGRAHARLSASGSKRWISCPRSVSLEAMFPERKSSVYADEGTAAHELADLLLRFYLDLIVGNEFEAARIKARSNTYFSQEMDDHVKRYLDIVIERINEARSRTHDAIVGVEERLDFSEWVPDGFGTGDVLIISDGLLEIIDLKYGKGVPVSAEGNSQMRLYALGAINQYGYLYQFDRIRMTIVQPRLDSVSTDEMSVDELLAWAETVVRPAAELALAGSGPTVPGDHCQFCSARSECRARAEYHLELAKYEFRDAALLSVEEIADVLARADQLVKWAGDVTKHALEQAEKHGVRYPGWKLVEGRSNRIYMDKQAVAETLLIEGFTPAQIYEPQEILGITALEKSIGKKQFSALLSEFIVKPTGKPTLVQASDSRPEISSEASAVADFADQPE